MYKSTDYEYEQLSFINFNMACGMQLDMNNEWIHIAQKLPWRAWETLYVAMFPSNTGNVAKPCRMVLGALIIQTRLGFSDRELVDQLRQNPYYRKSAPLSVRS
ncbi:MAG: transposase [Acidaminococcaceae bacterium]|nr:transposase [Acidaminococcaceae bacterium]